jgi:hypothetical protein
MTRAELTVTDGLPPEDLPRGDFFSTLLYDEHEQPAGVRIDHADPRILISGELLDQFHDDPGPVVSVDPGENCCFSYVGAVVKIHGVNRTVIYRITDFVPRVNGYIAEWPD